MKTLIILASAGLACVLAGAVAWAQTPYPDYVCTNPYYACVPLDCIQEGATCEGKSYNRHKNAALTLGNCAPSDGSTCPVDAHNCVNYKHRLTGMETECNSSNLVCTVAGNPINGCKFGS